MQKPTVYLNQKKPSTQESTGVSVYLDKRDPIDAPRRTMAPVVTAKQQPPATGAVAASMPSRTQLPYLQRKGFAENTKRLDNGLKTIGDWFNVTNPFTKMFETADAVVNVAAKNTHEQTDIYKQIDSLKGDRSPEGLRRLAQLQSTAQPRNFIAEAMFNNYQPQTSPITLQAQNLKSKAMENLKRGKSEAGQLAVDVAAGAGELLGDIGIATTTGIPIAALYGVTGGAQAAQTALNDGYSADKALQAGLASGIVTSQIERLGGIGGNAGAKWLGKAAQTATGKALLSKAPKAAEYIGKLASSKLGRIAGNMLSEGAEEFAEYDVQRIVNNLILDKDTPHDVKEQLRNTIVGGGIGALFGAANVTLDSKSEKTATIAVEDPAASAPARLDIDADNEFSYSSDDVVQIRHEGKTFRNIVAGHDTSVSEFFNKWWNGRKSHGGEKLEKLYLGKVSPNVAEMISKAMGYDVDSSDFIITNDAVKHIADQHGDASAELQRGNVPLDNEKIAMLSEVVKHPTSVYRGELENAGSQRHGIVFEKVLDDGTMIYVQFDNKGRGTLEGRTLYIKKEAATSAVNAKANTFTSKTTEPATSYDSNISQDDIGVNTSSAPSSTQNASMTSKGQNLYNAAVRKFSTKVGESMSVPKKLRKAKLVPNVGAMLEELRDTGRVSGETADRVFEAAYQKGIIVNDEFYQQYKPLKDRLRTARITISDTDKPDVGDYAGFIKSNRGQLNLVADGLPVDSFYQEIAAEYPAMFPLEVTHPADQLKRLAEVASEIRKVEVDLNAYYGDDASNFKDYMRNSFDKALASLVTEAQLLYRYEQDRSDAMSAVNESIPLTPQQVQATYSLLQKEQRAQAALMSKMPMTAADKKIADGIALGYLSDVPAGQPNANAIRMVASQKQNVADLGRVIKEHKEQVRHRYNSQAEGLLVGSEAWKNKKSGYLVSMNTMERNIFDIVPDEAQAQYIVDTVFLPVKENEALSTQLKRDIVNRVRPLDLSTKKEYEVELAGEAPIQVSESGLVHLLGEKKITTKDISDLGADVDKITQAVPVFRAIYDELFDMANEAYIRNGYAPMEKRGDYFPHFSTEEPQGAVAKVANAMGERILADTLPTDLAGKTHLFKAGRRHFGHALQRVGKKTEYDAVEGLQRYLEPVSDVIYHTDDIQRVRALERAVRRQYSNDGVQEGIDAARDDPTMTEDERIDTITALTEKDITHLSSLAVELGRYADVLANKKNVSDRDWEQKLGRGMYSGMQAIEGRIASNMIGFNLSSALTNYIPLTMATAEIPPQHLLRGMRDAVEFLGEADDIAKQSTFLTNRRGYDRLTTTISQKIGEIGATPMQAIDNYVSEAVVRSRYYQNIDGGMDAKQAMREADAYAGQLMGERSKGSMPTVFSEKNPIMKARTMFQLEVNNQFKYLTKDFPRNVRARVPEDKVKQKMLMGLMSSFIGAFLYNELFEKLTGRRAAFDPLGIVQETYDNFTNPNVSSGKAVVSLATNLVQEVPFIGGLLGGGRVPISGALMDGEVLANNFFGMMDGDVAPNKAISEIGNELLNSAALLLPPSGGNQLKKTMQGLQTFAQGGSYKLDKEGNQQMQFNVPQTAENLLRSIAFGKWSTPQAKQYVDNGFKLMPAKYTKALQTAKDMGIKPETFFDIYLQTRSIVGDKDADGKTIRLSGDEKMKLKINSLLTNPTRQQKEMMYEAFGISKELW